MTKYAKLVDNVVVQVQPNSSLGFIEVPDDTVCGQIWNGSSFDNPEPDIVPAPATIIKSTNGTLFYLTINDDGSLQTDEVV